MKLKVLVPLIVLTFVGGQLVQAQEYQDRDSLWRELSKAKQDSIKVWLYIQLGQQYETNDPDSALQLYESALKLSQDLNYKRGEISYYTNATYVYNIKGMYDTALSLNLRSVELAKAFGDPERLAVCMGNVAASYSTLGQPEKAIEINLEILPLLEKLPKSVNVGVWNQNLSMLYNEISQPAKAKRYGQEAVNIFRELKNEYGLAGALNNLAITHIALGEYTRAIELLIEAEGVARRTNNQYVLMSTLLNLSDVNIDIGNFSSVRDYCSDALSLARKLNDPEAETIALRGIAMYHFNMNHPSEAEDFANQSLMLALQGQSIKQVGKAYSLLSDIAILRKDFQRHNTLSMKSDSIRNLVLNESIAKNIQNIEARYESQKKEERIRELQQQTAIKDLSIERNRLFNGVLIGSLAAVLIIALLARTSYQQKQKLLMQDNQVQEARIAQLESEKLILAGEAVIQGQEEERGRLAKDLHDGLGGLLSGVKFSLSNMKSNVILDADNLLVYERTLDMLDHSIGELRRVAHNMMPEVLVRFGLSEALRSYCESVGSSQMFKVAYQSIGAGDRLPEKTEIFVFRIVQELVNNVIKHAHASYVLVQLARHDNEVSVTIEDNGKGFDPQEKRSGASAGLANVQSRVDYLKGRLDLQSAPGQGTSIHITIPL